MLISFLPKGYLIVFLFLTWSGSHHILFSIAHLLVGKRFFVRFFFKEKYMSHKRKGTIYFREYVAQRHYSGGFANSSPQHVGLCRRINNVRI